MSNSLFVKVFFALFFVGLFFSVSGQSVKGKWKTIDDETGKPRSVVEIFERNGKLYGRVEKLFREPHEEQDPFCKECADDRRNKRVIGMEIIRDMMKDGSDYEGGTICDPKNGKVYDCEFWLDEKNPDILHVRGYILFFFRTQSWQRID
jgi:uncharacterized protein (DUF2147 family)